MVWNGVNFTLCGWNAHQCHKGLHEACDEQVVWYHVVARWVCVFQGGRESNKYKLGTSWPITAGNDICVTCVSTLLDINWLWMCWTVKCDWYCIIYHQQNPNTELENFKKQKICAQWLLHTMTEVHAWQCTETVRLHCSFYELEDEAVLHWRHRPIHMNLNWRDSDMNDSVKVHHTHDNVDRNSFIWVSCFLWLRVTRVFSPHILFFLALQ